MKKLTSALILTLLTSSYALAATEISAAEAKEKNLTLVEVITSQDRTFNSCSTLISKKADDKQAEFYVIKAVNFVGKGDGVSIKAELYK